MCFCSPVHVGLTGVFGISFESILCVVVLFVCQVSEKNKCYQK